MPAFVSTAPGEYRAEAVLAGMTRQYRELALRDYGIDVVDVRLRRLDFPEQNRASVSARMKSERIRISMQYRSEGEEEGLEIRAAAEKAKSGILGEAYKLSQQMRGEGEARAAKIYGESLTRAPSLVKRLTNVLNRRSPWVPAFGGRPRALVTFSCRCEPGGRARTCCIG